MIVDRKELFGLMGLGPEFGRNSHVVMATENGARRATARWNDDGFSADITSRIEGETGEVVIVLAGGYIETEDGFDLDAEDNRDEASAPEDPRSAASAYRMLTSDMHAIA